MKNALSTLCLGLLVAGASAQVTTPGSEYIIQGVYSPTLMDAQKIDLVMADTLAHEAACDAIEAGALTKYARWTGESGGLN